MRRTYTIIGGASVVACVLACAVGGWLALAARNAPFIAPTATNVSISDGLNERVITYGMGDPEIGWNSTVARRLSISGWNISYNGYEWGATEHYVTAYQRSKDFWVLHLNERAELLGDKRSARIHIVSRWVWQWP